MSSLDDTAQADTAFHGYEPIRIVDDVINSFNDCAPRFARPLSIQAASLLAARLRR